MKINYLIGPKAFHVSVDKVVRRKVHRKMALVELPQTRTEVVAVNAHTDPNCLYISSRIFGGAIIFLFQEIKYVECVQIRRSVLTGERLELR